MGIEVVVALGDWTVTLANQILLIARYCCFLRIKFVQRNLSIKVYETSEAIY